MPGIWQPWTQVRSDPNGQSLLALPPVPATLLLSSLHPSLAQGSAPVSLPVLWAASFLMGEVEAEGKGMFGLSWQQILQAQIYRDFTKTLQGEGTAYL